MKIKIQGKAILSILVIYLAWVTASYGQNETDNICLQIVADLDGSMWLATKNGAINVPTDGKVTTYDTSKGLNSNLVTQIFIDKDGSRWFIHSGVYNYRNSFVMSSNGVSHLKKDGTIEIFSYSRGYPSLGFVYGITADIDNTKWFATAEGAVHLKANGEIEVFTEKDGLPSSDVRHILVDKNGLRWFATLAGTARMDTQGRIVVVHPEGNASIIN